jgi:uncharacterized protein YciI
MERLAKEGQLLVAGPLGEPRADPAHRGLWVFDTSDVATALEHGATDPTVKLGVFVLAAYPFTTDAPLRELPGLEQQDEARRLADPDVPDEWSGRSYLLATRPMSDEMAQKVRESPGVLLSGRLHGTAEGQADELIVWLDAQDAEAARKLLPDAAGWTLHGWYGSRMVEQMRRGA